jgi:acetyl esterase/lipase
MARDRHSVHISAQVLLAPLLDPSMTRLADDSEGQAHFDLGTCASCYRAYLPTAMQQLHPYAAPLESRRLSGLPPALIASVYGDRLHVEAERYASELIAAGVPTEVIRYRNTTRKELAGFPAALEDVIGFFQKKLSRQQSRLVY